MNEGKIEVVILHTTGLENVQYPATAIFGKGLQDRILRVVIAGSGKMGVNPTIIILYSRINRLACLLLNQIKVWYCALHSGPVSIILSDTVAKQSFIMKTNTTFLTFVGDNFGKAEEAVRFYTSLFADGDLRTIQYFKKDEPGGEEGAVKHCSFRMGGQDYMAIDSSMAHGFSFSPAISILVRCETMEEIDTLYAQLSDGGHAMMPIGNYGFSERFAWVSDRYGVSWQLNLG